MVIFSERKLCIWIALADLIKPLACIFLISLAYVLNCPFESGAFLHCRLGWLIRFISHSVISGFTTSSAIVIALSQAKYFLGYSIVRSSKIIPLIKSIVAGASKVCYGMTKLLFLFITYSSSF